MGWAGNAPTNHVFDKNLNREVSKIEFLKNCIPNRQSRNGSYTEDFKTKMASLAINGTRAFVRKKFNIPETTLRGWIKTHKQRR